jgi:hypothetical protein
MSEPEKQCTLLEELDQRQDEVLAQLEDLNNQIECLLKNCLQFRSDQEETMDHRLSAQDKQHRTAA